MDNGRGSGLMFLEGVSRRFDTKGVRIDILNQVDFTIARGDTIAVVGASGIGKSTLLHIIGTLDKPDEGRIFFGKTDLFGLDQEGLARFRNQSIGFVFQFHHLLYGFTSMENVMIPCLINKMPPQEAKKRAVSILERVGLKKRISHRAEDLSGGEQQRVALARALVLNPVMLLADEPTGNLDIKNSEAVHNLLLELNQELGMTVVVVTHNNDLAKLMNQRVTLKECKIVSLQ